MSTVKVNRAEKRLRAYKPYCCYGFEQRWNALVGALLVLDGYA